MIYSKLKKAYLVYKVSRGLKKYFRKKFIKKKNIPENKILLEFNAFHSYHVPVAYFSNYLLQGFGGIMDWRYMLGVEAIPSIFFILSYN